MERVVAEHHLLSRVRLARLLVLPDRLLPPLPAECCR